MNSRIIRKISYLVAVIAIVALSNYVTMYYLNRQQNGVNVAGYTVQNGDTLFLIGVKFGVPWQQIAQYNHMKSPYTLVAGEILGIPLINQECAVGNNNYNITYAKQNITFPTRYVMLRFDDSYQDQWTYVLPILAKYGFRAVFAVVAGLVLKVNICGLSDSWEKMNWQEVYWLHTHGNEISDHTMTHVHLDNQSLQGLDYQIVQSKALFLQNNLPVSSLTLPYGEGSTNLTVLNYIFNSGFQYVYPIGDYESTAVIEYHNGIISNFTTIGNRWFSISDLNNQSFANFKELADTSSNNYAVGFLFHHVNDHVSSTGYFVNMTIFEQDMAYLHDNGFDVILPSELPGY